MSLREHACVSSRGAQSTELVSLYIGYWTLNNYYYYYYYYVNPQITSFELMEAVLTICSISLRLSVIYRMPPSKINGLKSGIFYEEFSEYVEKHSCASGKVIIIGDFNIIGY